MVVKIGKIINNPTTKAIVTAKGADPMKISRNVIDLSCKLLLTTNTEIPKGGVKSPISTAITVIIPNQTKSTPIGLSSGKNKGTVIKMMEIESMIVPKIKTMIKNTSMMTQRLRF
jgi:hypothetical protein